jgi:hypothetical protein
MTIYEAGSLNKRELNIISRNLLNRNHPGMI